MNRFESLERRVRASARYRWAKRRERTPFLRDGDSLTMWQRQVMNASVRDYVEQRDPTRMSAIEVSGSWWRDHPWERYCSTSFPDFDLVSPPEDFDGWGQADVVFCEQVLEHVPDPVAAARHLVRLARPGGAVIVSTPFLVKIHAAPDDYWRFTPRGMETPLSHAGLVDLEVQAWGNRACVRSNFRRWTPQRAWRSLKNDPEVPVQVWCIGHRPADG